VWAVVIITPKHRRSRRVPLVPLGDLCILHAAPTRSSPARLAPGVSSDPVSRSGAARRIAGEPTLPARSPGRKGGGRAPGRARRVARRRGRSAGSCYPAATQRPQFEPGRCLHRCLHLRFPAPHHHVPSWRSQVRILPGSPLRNGPFRAHAFVNRLGGVALAPGSCANWRAMLIPKHAAAAPRTAADVSKSLAGSNKHHAERAPISAMTRTARWCGIACQNNCPAPVASGPAAVAPAQRGS